MKNFLMLLVIALLLLSCADVVVVKQVMVDPYGFWGGLWHGMVLPISWIGSLLSDDIAIYAINNTGGWYDFGFALGTPAILGGGSSTVRSRR